MDSIIFDVDGTLLSFETHKVSQSSIDALKKVHDSGIKIVIAEIIASMFGQPLPDIAKQIFPDASREEQLRLIDRCCNAEHEALLKECAPLYEDLEKALQLLAEKYPLYIVSNCEAGYIEVFLEATGFGKYFKGHLCNGDNNLDKGSNISLIARTYDMKSPVYVGDTMGDFLSCRKAGVPFVFASYGFGDVPEPDEIIRKPMDLVDLFC